MIYLVRHGESEANINKRFSGITDVALSLNGRNEARLAGQNLKFEKISHVFTSPLIRAKDSAKIICNEINYDENKIIIENSLIEVNFGLFENLTWDEISSTYKDESEIWIKDKLKYRFPQGEGYDDIIKRISKFIDNVPDNSLIVTHFGVIQSIMLYLNITDDINLWDFKISNCDIVVLKDKKFERIIRNENGALSEFI